MPLYIEWSGGTKVIAEHETAIVGRANEVEITIGHNKVSRHHLLFCFQDNVWVARDLESANGSFVDDKRLTELRLEGMTDIHLGGQSGPSLSVSVMERRASVLGATTAELPRPITHRDVSGRITLGERVRLGRDQTNDVVLDELETSRFHCEVVTKDGRTHEVVDLGSASGTYVNGVKVKRRRLSPGDLVSVGPTTLRYAGGALEKLGAEGGPSLSVSHIGVEIGGKRLLQDISFDLKPHSLTAIIGPSGAGKSTLLDVLTGMREPTYGSVSFGSRDLHANLDELRSRLGYVPQTDLLHTNLTVKKALRYGADLRFSKDTTPKQKTERVEKVIQDLGLEQRADLRIDRLSGGQRKRTSVALELLTEPLLLFLDEPTSGLDPGLDRQVMNLLRTLADEGRTIVVVTHSTANLDVCDDVVVLAPGGSVAYFGSPLTVLKGLESRDWSEAFDKVERKAIQSPPPVSSSYQRETKARLAPAPKQPWIYQLFTLMRRYVAVIAADKTYLLFLLAMPLIVAAVGFIAGNDDGLAAGDDEAFGLNLQARSLLLIILLGAAFMGTASSIQELVKERAIYQRERNTGLSSSAYVVSKILVLGVLVIAQSAVFIAITLGGRPLPESGLVYDNALVELLLVVALLAFVSMVIGLAISQLAGTTEVAMPALVVATMSQVVLSGAVPLRFDGVTDTLGLVNPAYWAMNAMSSTIDLNVLIGHEDSDVVATWEATASTLMTSLTALVLYALLAVVAIVIMGSVKSKR